MLHNTVETDITIIGGGLAGVCAAVAAARMGRTVSLINNRPVLGGNASSEVRVWVCGATAHGNQRWARENGIIGEMILENQYRNPEGNPIYWDDVVLDTVRREENITLYLNTDVRHLSASGPSDNRRIESVTGWTMGSEIETTFTSQIFIDCTGDGLVGELAGAEYRLGKESKAEFGEEWAPEEPKREFLGSTLLFYTKDHGSPVKFVAPESTIDITKTAIPSSRIIRSGDSGAHYWWVEWGGQQDIVHDNEEIRDELRGVILGIWDYIKNSGNFEADNLTMEWIGNIPGKREYRRFIGDYTLTQSDIQNQVSFPDTVTYGGWSIDLHPAEGMYHEGAGAVQRFPLGLFEIPYRMLYSRNVSNMFMAGRNASATHIAFGASRVMATCAGMGEAVGTAASMCITEGLLPREVGQRRIKDLQQQLLLQDAPVLGIANEHTGDLARTAQVTASSYLPAPSASVHDDAPNLDSAAPRALEQDLGIVLPVDTTLEEVSVWVRAAADTTMEFEIYTSDLPQNVVPQHLARQYQVAVPAGDWSWVKVQTNFIPTSASNVVFVLKKNPDIEVLVGEPLPAGVLMLVHGQDADDANVDVGEDQLLLDWPTKPLRGKTIAFSTRAAASQVFAPEQATSGFNRPFGGPNMWVSREDDAQPWLQLSWNEPVQANQVRVVLDDNVDLSLNNLHHHRSPHEIQPELLRDYSLEVLRDGADSWTQIAAVAENRTRQQVHSIAGQQPFRALRLVVKATNGARSARVVQLRVQQ